MKYKKYLSGRSWLNPQESDDQGAIQYSVSSEAGFIDATLSIWDCSRKISLCFNFHDKKHAEQRVKKIDTLIQALQEIKQAMGKAYPDIQQED